MGFALRILAIIPAIYDTSPGQRFRFEQWMPFLREWGVEIDYEPFEDEELHSVLYKQGRQSEKARRVIQQYWRRLRVLRHVREFDAVYVFRETALLGPPIFEPWIHRTGVPLVFDFDDAVWLSVLSGPNGKFSLLKFNGMKTRAACRYAAHVMAGNEYLAQYARQYCKDVSIVPTTIDVEKYTVNAKAISAVPVIGWSGSFSTVPCLDIVRGALQRLAKEVRFRLRVVGTADYRLEGVEVASTGWCSATELDDLRSMDIGLMPLPDDQWCRGKCGLKALQYMALGIPTVVSPVGVNASIIEDGKNGFWAVTEDEWVEKLRLLLSAPDIRHRLGAAGRATVEERYSAQVQAPRVFAILRKVTKDRKQGAFNCAINLDSKEMSQE